MNIIIMILLISLLILVHELGHYFAARFFGIKVAKFGFGLPFGPTLFEKKIGDTTFCIHAFLLGGYVSFPDDDKDFDLPEDSPELFRNKPIGQRAFVVSAGVIANILCAMVLVFMTASVWGKLPENKYEVYVTKIVAEQGASVYTSGLKAGDRIVSINAQQITHPMMVNFYAQLSKKFDGTISQKRYESQLDKLKSLNKDIDISKPVANGVAVVLPPWSEEDAVLLTKEQMYGVSNNDKTTISLTGEQKKLRQELLNSSVYISNGTHTMEDLAKATADTVKPLNIIVNRDGKEITLSTIYPNQKGIIGIEKGQKELFTDTKTLKTAIIASNKYLWDNTYTMLWGLGKIFSGQIPLKDLHGIVAITKVGGDVIQQQGLFKGFLLTAIISLNLAIVNLLPIPALDGGHLLFMIVEKIRGRALSEKTLERIANIGFFFLIILMLVVIFNDIIGLMTNKF